MSLLLAAGLVAGCTRPRGPVPTARTSTVSLPSPSPTPALSTASVSPSPTETVAPTPTPTPTAYADSTGDAVIADMTAAVRTATSVHYFGSLVQGGRTVDVDVRTGRRGTDGTVDFPSGRVELLRARGVLYIKAAAAVWRADGVDDERALARVADKWVQLSAADAARFRVFTDLESLLSGFEHPGYAVTGTTSVGRVDAVELRDASGTVLAVSVAAPHVPLRVTSAARQGTLTFTKWNAPLTVRAPANPVDLSAPPAG